MNNKGINKIDNPNINKLNDDLLQLKVMAGI